MSSTSESSESLTGDRRHPRRLIARLRWAFFFFLNFPTLAQWAGMCGASSVYALDWLATMGQLSACA